MKLKGESIQQEEVPGSIGKLEDDLVLQIIDLAQPAVIGYVVTIHEGLRRKQKTKLINISPRTLSHQGNSHTTQAG